MNINAESRFAVNPTSIDIQRSKFDRSSQHKTTFNAGELIPFFVDEVLPGDTFSMETACVARMSTPIHPVMDNSYLDMYYFFVANRMVWDHWKEFNGENNTTAWEQTVEYEIPQVTAPASNIVDGVETGGFQKGTIADYMGIPIHVPNLSINALPGRALVKIFNDWFRDENVQDPAFINTDDSTLAGSNGSTYQTDAQAYGRPLPVNKFHDYFTSALPEPQKGPDVLLPLGDTAPIIGNSPISFKFENQNTDHQIYANTNTTGQKNLLMDNSEATASSYSKIIYSSGLNVDLTNATASTVNQLRLAFQLQKLYERDARGGTRYTEVIKSHFGVTSSDQRMQRPEYLGGKRIPINVQQVVQTSSTDSTSPQGNTAAYSLTGDNSESFTKSFEEHGFIIGVCCVRTEHTYQQGLERMWSRKRRFDYYWPALANIGEQAILNKEIYAQGTSVDDEVFGYQEAWAEYRYKPSRVSGAFRSTYAQPLDSWHYADYYESLPVLGDTWMRETKNNIDRTLAVQSSVEDQFIVDFFFKTTCVRPMPMYSIPGLMDHN